MSAGIQEFDIGFVNGTTWHGLPQYVRLDRAPNAPRERKAVAGTLDGVVGNSGGDK